MPMKWVMHWKPNADSSVNTQILDEVLQCAESMYGNNKGPWKANFTIYKPILRDPSRANEVPRELTGVTLPDQPNKHYLILREKKIVIEADASISTIMQNLKSYMSGVALVYEGVHYEHGDFYIRVGKAVSPHYETLRGIIAEVEYRPNFSTTVSKLMMEDFFKKWQQAVSQRSLPGNFLHVEPNFADYGLGEYYTPQHTAVQYNYVLEKLVYQVLYSRPSGPSPSGLLGPFPSIPPQASLFELPGPSSLKPRRGSPSKKPKSSQLRPLGQSKLGPSELSLPPESSLLKRPKPLGWDEQRLPDQSLPIPLGLCPSGLLEPSQFRLSSLSLPGLLGSRLPGPITPNSLGLLRSSMPGLPGSSLPGLLGSSLLGISRSSLIGLPRLSPSELLESSIPELPGSSLAGPLGWDLPVSSLPGPLGWGLPGSFRPGSLEWGLPGLLGSSLPGPRGPNQSGLLGSSHLRPSKSSQLRPPDQAL